MDEITTKGSELKLSGPHIHVYAQAFNDIVAFICQKFPGELSAAEIDVTKSFAGPFSSGGLLVVLLEPRQRNNWREGAHVVISDCASLSALEEGLQITSNSILSISHRVSLLDLRPFICQSRNGRLTDREREILYGLVVKAMDAKKPDVVLCMGKEPKGILSERRAQFSDEFRKRAEWVYGIHPSHSVNYNSGDLVLRTQLLNSIAEACQRLQAKSPEILPAPTWCGDPDGQLRLIPSRESQRDTRWVENLLWTLMVLCLRPRHRLPVLSLNTNAYYKLAHWQEGYFNHVLENSDVKDDKSTIIAIALIPLFRRLNKTLKTTSWYLQTYEANWGEIANVLSDDGLATLENICRLLDSNESHGACGNGVNTQKVETDERNEILSHGKSIALQIADQVHNGFPRLERNAIWIQIAN